MPIILPSTILAESERPHQPNPWVWFFEVYLARGDETTPPVVLRATGSDREIAWPVGASPTVTWYPFPFTFSEIEQNQEGDLPQLQAQLDNSTRFLMRYLHAGDIEGNKANFYLVPTAALEIPSPDHESMAWELEVAAVQADSGAITLRIERQNFFRHMTPADRYIPKRCRHAYGSARCGYVLNSFAAFDTCEHSEAACDERGLDLIARGLPAVLPGNFGGHPGIATPR